MGAGQSLIGDRWLQVNTVFDWQKPSHEKTNVHKEGSQVIPVVPRRTASKLQNAIVAYISVHVKMAWYFINVTCISYCFFKKIIAPANELQ